uniref:Ig-like domain-containing protein n=1 Tax=Oryzias latipes TaxID=8090 RepID=A0A3P9I0X3_ORYLA
MIKSLFVYGMVGALLLLPVQPDQISVCVEDDEDLRVDCMIKPAPNKINSYEFSWSSGTKEVLINTNVSGSKAEAQFNDKSQVVELEPHGYRMTLSDFKDKLPPNTTYMCKIYGEMKQITVEKDSLVPCSAVSVFLQRSWFLIACLVFFLHHNDS